MTTLMHKPNVTHKDHTIEQALQFESTAQGHATFMFRLVIAIFRVLTEGQQLRILTAWGWKENTGVDQSKRLPGCNRGNNCPWGTSEDVHGRTTCSACGLKSSGSGQ